MSQPEHHALNVCGINCHRKKPQDSRPYPEFDDSSEPLYTMYCKMTEGDNEKAKFLQGYYDVMIIFVRTPLILLAANIKPISQMGLYLAVIAAILAVTIQDLKPDTQERTAFYLEKLYELQFPGDSNGSLPSTPARPPPFSAPTYAIWSNSLSFMSLIFGLCTAILAISIRHWMTKCLLFTRSLNNSPHYRARMQDVIVNEYQDLNSNSLHVWVVIVMAHLSAFLLWAGVAIYLFHYSKTVFIVSFSTAVFCLFWYLSIVYGLGMVRSKARLSPGDVRILDRLFNAVVEDSDLVQFFENMLAFCKSKVVDHPLQKITELGSERLQTAMQKLLEHTWSSNLTVSEKLRRLVVCVNFADTILFPSVTSSIFEHISTQDQHDALSYVEMWHLLRPKGRITGQKIGSCAQSIVAGIISKVQADDSDWVALATDQLGPSLPHYLEHGNDSVLLANLIHITRQILESSRDDPGWDMADALSFNIFPTLSNFDIRNTLPELQQDFLALWNEMEQTQNDKLVAQVRDRLRNFHDALPLGSRAEDRHDPPTHMDVDPLANRDTRSITSIRSSSNLTPVSMSPIPSSSRMLLQRASGPITPEPAEELSPGGLTST
ncbi:hypothetical protein BGW80DRAFT_1507767 [Lactifluus volemus]|nr:hypothetical protein BGW80DRAFT_1507767 [Lactifluus volemus]